MNKKYYIWLLAAFVLLYIVPLGVRPMLTPDEFRYGEIPREMIANSDWVVPRLNGFRYFEKPVLGYWLNAVSMLIFGENAFGVRFSSALSIGLAAVLVWLLVKRMKRDDELAFFSAAIFMTTGLVYGIGTFATMDAMTMLFLTGSMVFFMLAQAIPQFNRAKIFYLILFGVCCGAACLVKGFVAFVVPGLAIASYLIWKKRWKDIVTLPWIPLVVAVLVILPWGIAIHLREPDFWHYFIKEEHINRFLGKSEGQHYEPFWYYIPVLAGGWMPWLLLVPAAVYFCRSKLKSLLKDDLFRFCFCALVMPFIFFSICSGKLGTYLLPCFPFIAIMTAYLLKEMFMTASTDRYYRIHTKILLILLAVGLAGFAVAQIIADAGVYHGLYHEETASWLLCIAGGVIALGFLFMSLRAADWRMRAAWLTAFAVPLFMLSMLAAPGLPFEGKAQGLVIEKVVSRVHPDSVIVVHRNMIHAACWELKRDDIWLFGSPGEFDYGIKHGSAARWIGEEQILELIRTTPKGKLVVMQRGDFREGGRPAAGFELYEHELMISIY